MYRYKTNRRHNRRKGSFSFSWSAILQELKHHPLAKWSMLGATVIAGFLFVVQINVTATKGYDIRQLEQRVVELEKEKDILALEAVELQSTDRIQAQMGQFELVKASPDAYMSTSTAVFAAR